MVRVVHTEESCGWGGQEQRILRECLALRARGHELALICQPRAELAQRAADAGLPVWLVPLAGQVSVPTFLRFHRALRDLEPAIVHTHSSIDSWMGVYARPFFSYRLVRTRHIQMPIRNLLAYRRCDHLIVTGEDTRDWFIGRGFDPARVSFIPTGIEAVPVPPAGLRAELDLPAGTPLVATVSVLRSWKGHQPFIAAAERLLADGLDAAFLIIGDGPQRPVLEARLAASPHRARIRRLGHRENVMALLAEVDLLAHPSTAGEGVPQAILQAWVAKRAVVATAIPNVRRLVESGVDGVLVPPGDAAALADAIRDLLGDPARRQRLGAAGYEKATTRYRWSETVDRTEAIYRSLIENGRDE